jgi:hypothetical protein
MNNKKSFSLPVEQVIKAYPEERILKSGQSLYVYKDNKNAEQHRLSSFTENHTADADEGSPML